MIAANPDNLFTPYNRRIKFFNSEGYPKRFLGVELEIARMDLSGAKDLKKTATKWQLSIHDDGSLPQNGFEINSAPARGSAFVKQITEICDVLNKNQAKITGECGLHVHVDARDFTTDDIFKTTIVWQKIQNNMFRYCDKNRKNNRYCHPTHHSFNNYSSLDYLRKVPAYKQLDILQARAKNLTKLLNGEKYSAINFIHLSKNEYGTIENRMHQGSTNSKKIIRWAAMNSNLLDFVKNISVRDSKRIPANEIMKVIRQNTEF
jgi:Putative amidoligase enzyme